MRRWLCVSSVVCSTLISFATSLSARADIELYVALHGDDSAIGTQDSPLATLAGAQARLRKLRQASAEASNAHVWISSGVYELTEPLELTEADNAPGAKTVYESLPGERVIVRGGRTIAANAWQPVDASTELSPESKAHVRVLDLAQCDIEHPGHDHLRRARHSAMHPVPLELFAGDKRLPVASWPNQGWSQLKAFDQATHSWEFAGLRPTSEKTVKARAHGFWQHDWQDSCEPIQLRLSANHKTCIASVDAPHADHMGNVRAGARFRIENLLSELDSPGEWFHDTERHLLYAWLPNADAECFVSTIDTPISCYDVQDLTLRGLVIEGARACCVEIAGGENVCLDQCELRHAGNLGVHIYHGLKHCVTNSEIYSTGAGAIRVEGGHRETLQACEHVIEHNRLHDYAQLQLAYRPAVNVYGVGVVVRHNAIFDAPHAAIVLHGNEHLVEHNEIHHVCQETDDVGAIYLAHNPTYRGNVVRNNYVHDLGGFSKTGVVGIYLDDFASGTHVTHNVLERAGRGVAVGGGRDNVIENNLFLDCLAAVQIDGRGTTWGAGFFKGNRPQLDRYLDEIGENFELFTQRYPELGTLRSDSPELPKGNRVARNIYSSPIGIDLQTGSDQRLVEVVDNFADRGARFVAVEGMRYEVSAQSIAAKAGIESIEIGQVGPQDTVYTSK